MLFLRLNNLALSPKKNQIQVHQHEMIVGLQTQEAITRRIIFHLASAIVHVHALAHPLLVELYRDIWGNIFALSVSLPVLIVFLDLVIARWLLLPFCLLFALRTDPFLEPRRYFREHPWATLNQLDNSFSRSMTLLSLQMSCVKSFESTRLSEFTPFGYTTDLKQIQQLSGMDKS